MSDLGPIDDWLRELGVSLTLQQRRSLPLRGKFLEASEQHLRETAGVLRVAGWLLAESGAGGRVVLGLVVFGGLVLAQGFLVALEAGATPRPVV